MTTASSVVKAIAHKAHSRGLTPEELGAFSDDAWRQLRYEAEAVNATARDCADAVDYLRRLQRKENR